MTEKLVEVKNLEISFGEGKKKFVACADEYQNAF